MGDTFPKTLKSPEETSTQSSRFPSSISSSPPPIPARSVARKVTPRPHLFPSLQEAHSHVYRTQPQDSSRNASGDHTRGRVGNESAVEDMSPPTNAIGRSLTGNARPVRKYSVLPQFPSSPTGHGFMNVALPVREPVSWDNVPQPLSTARMVSETKSTTTSTLPELTSSTPPCGSENSFDHIINEYARQLSSSGQSQAAADVSNSEPSSLPAQNRTKEGSDATTCLAKAPHAVPVPGGLRKTAFVNTPAPQIPLPADPPFTSSKKLYRPSTPWPSQPVFAHSSISQTAVTDTGFDDDEEEEEYYFEHNQAQLGSDLGVGSGAGSDVESKVNQLLPPPARMHSTRGAKQSRRSIQSTVSSSAGGFMTEGSDEDPFKYDRVFFHPSKEREVSACLRKVSGLERESRASIYSQDGTPSKTYAGNYELFGEAVSPGTQQILHDLTRLHTPSHHPGNVPQGQHQGQHQGPGQHHSAQSRGEEFYNPGAIESEWTLGSPDVVKIPVKNKVFGGTQRNLQETSGPPRSENQLRWDQLRRDEGQSNRLTGNTED